MYYIGTMPEKTDEEIAGEIQRGDTQAFGILIERYEGKLLRYGRKFLFDREDVRDLVQDVFLKTYVNIRSFDPSKRFSPWIYRIAHNEFLNAVKKKIRHPLLFFDFDAFFPKLASKETADSDLDHQELKQLLDQCLGKLDVKYREPLVLYYFEDLDYRTIAEVLHIPVATVGVRIRRGKERLRKMFLDINKNYGT